MDQPWYRKLFRHSEKGDLETTKVKAEEGNANAQFDLALNFAISDGANQDYGRAAEWYLKAADQSHCLAQFNLGMMYSIGQGVPQDEVKAMMWFQKAAHQGDAGAQFNLGMSHYRASLGRLSKDMLEAKIEAYKWFYLAHEQGYRGSGPACESVNLSMTREEVADGNRRVAAFVVVNPKHSPAH